MTAHVDFLRRVPIFAGLSESGLAELAGAVKEKSFGPNEFIVQEQTPGNEFFIIQSGRVEVVKHCGEPNETRLVELSAHDFFGEMSLIEARNRVASVRTLEPTIVLGLKASDLYHLFQHQQDQYTIVILNIARDLSRRLRALDEHFTARAH